MERKQKGLGGGIDRNKLEDGSDPRSEIVWVVVCRRTMRFCGAGEDT